MVYKLLIPSNKHIILTNKQTDKYPLRKTSWKEQHHYNTQIQHLDQQKIHSNIGNKYNTQYHNPINPNCQFNQFPTYVTHTSYTKTHPKNEKEQGISQYNPEHNVPESIFVSSY